MLIQGDRIDGLLGNKPILGGTRSDGTRITAGVPEPIAFESQRAFVRYHDLLKDWTVPLFELGEQFDLHSVKAATANDIRLVHKFIDPTLRRVSMTWDDIEFLPLGWDG